MKKSRFFADLAETYTSEVDDLASDSEGKTVLQARLKDKRQVFKEMLPMIEFSPEMVAVAFYDAFVFKDQAMMMRVIVSEPGRSDFPAWSTLAKGLTVAPWAQPLVLAALNEPAGGDFLVTTAVLEFLRNVDTEPNTRQPVEENEDSDDDADEDSVDLGEAGNDWMADQGFDSLNG